MKRDACPLGAPSIGGRGTGQGCVLVCLRGRFRLRIGTKIRRLRGIMAVSEPLRTVPLGLPLIASIVKDPLGTVSHLQRRFGDIARMNILFSRVWYFFSPGAVREIPVDHHAAFTRQPRQLKVFESFQDRNVLTTEGEDWERQRRILAPGFSPKLMAGYMQLMNAVVIDCMRSELPAEPGGSARVDVGALMTRITMDVILRTIFSHPTAQAISVAIRFLSQESMREFFSIFLLLTTGFSQRMESCIFFLSRTEHSAHPRVRIQWPSLSPRKNCKFVSSPLLIETSPYSADFACLERILGSNI